MSSQGTLGGMEKFSLKKIFHERMVYEGKEAAYLKRVCDLCKTLGRAAGTRQAMRDFGYVSVVHEKYLNESWRAHCDLFHEKKPIKEVREERKIENFEEAIRTLPPRCSPDEYWNWIGAHPALSRKARQSDKSRELVLDVDDVLKCSHGPAPSQEAVHALQFYANNVGKFYEYRDAYMKKAKTGSADSDKIIEKDLGIDDIKALIGEMGD